jgi:hypothetical protein
MTRSERTIDGVTYTPGATFRVSKAGAKLTGLTPSGGSSLSGWGQPLQVGDVLTCTGYGPGWGGDPGYGIEFTSEQSIASGAIHCAVWPTAGGPFNYRPAPGYLDPISPPAATSPDPVISEEQA